MSRSPILPFLLALGVSSAVPGGCDSFVDPRPGRSPVEVVLDASPLDLSVGESHTLDAVVLDGRGVAIPGADVIFTSSDPDVAPVRYPPIVVSGSNGPVVEGLFPGSAVVYATHGSLRDSVRVDVTASFEGNPLFWGADPAALVSADDQMWIYPTSDAHDWNELDHWNAWSSEDLETWTVHERIFGAEQCDWCSHNAWAPDVAYKDGRYYLYYYFRNDGVGGIGVAVGESPGGPFTNVTVNEPLVEGHDPNVFVDVDGQAYLYTGHVVRWLAHDMVGIQKENDGRERSAIVELRGHDPVGGWEAVWVFEREGLYYFTLADGDYRQLRYYIGESPTGPFDYGGTLLHTVQGVNIHHSIVRFRDRWILWYHLWAERGAGQRRIHGEFITFDPDGHIRPVQVSKEGVGGL